MSSLRLAVAFLTIAPVRLRGQAPPLGAAAAWFPLVGAAIGALAGGVGWLARPTLGAPVAAALAVAVVVVVTGALHQDALADCADGLGVRFGDRTRRLAVMRDSSIGAFGATALGLWLIVTVAALAELDRDDAFAALVVACVVARWSTLLHAAATKPARPDGLGAGFSVRAGGLIVATAIAAAAALGLQRLDGLAAIAAGLLVAVVVSAWARRALGGRSGDTLGATVALAEVAVLLTLLGLA